MEKQRLFPSQAIDSKQLIIAIVAAGIALRISGLTLSAIWYDEALSLEAAKLPFLSMLDATKFTFAPPLWGVIIWLSIQIFGANELALRLPALLAGIFTFWVVYKICDDFGLTNNQKMISLLFMSLLPYQLWIAQDGRVYAITCGLYLCAAWFAFRNRWLGLTACAGLLLYAHYTSPFYLIAIYAAAAINNGFNLKRLMHVFSSGAVAILSFLPWLPIYIATTKGDVPVPPLSIWAFLPIFYRLMFADTLNNSSILLILALSTIAVSTILAIISSIWLIWLTVKKGSQSAEFEQPSPAKRTPIIRYWQLILITLLPLALMVAWSLLWKNFIYYRLFVPMLIPMILWMVYTLTKTPSAWLAKYILFPTWIILLVAGLATWTPQSKSGHLRDTAELIRSQWRPGDIIYHITGTSYLPFTQYLGDKPEYLIDEQQNDWLMPYELQEMFGIERRSLESLSYQRAWVMYSRDTIITEQVNERAQSYIKNGTLIDIVKAWQFAPIEIYLVPIHR